MDSNWDNTLVFSLADTYFKRRDVDGFLHYLGEKDEDKFIMETIFDWMPFARSLNRLRDSCVRDTHTRTYGGSNQHAHGYPRTYRDPAFVY